MAGIGNITTGFNTKLLWDDSKIDAAESSITDEITDIQNIGDLSDTAAAVTVNSYGGDGYTKTLAGIKTFAPFDVVLNYKPIDTQHVALKAAYDAAKQVTFKISFIFGADETYLVFNANITGFSISTPADGVRAATVQIAPIGGFTISHKS
ncbi:hypothetical protein VME_45750 [Vibrio harveyi 1DA3]|nr:hypothetical protein VME_45750 [Vibrio harveyi 1DA3]